MRVRWGILLPFVQMAIAVVLLLLGYVHDRVATGVTPPPFETLLCYAISAPVLLLRLCYTYFLGIIRWPTSVSTGIIVDDALFISGAGLLWYLVGHAFDSRGQRRTSRKFLSNQLRMTADVLLVLFGAALGVVGIGERQYQYGFLLGTPFVLWSLAIVAFYGRDLVRLVRRKESNAP
jgi:hypothetical protein